MRRWIRHTLLERATILNHFPVALCALEHAAVGAVVLRG